jgi:hypothetical protein
MVLPAGTERRSDDLSRAHLADGRVVTWRAAHRDLRGHVAIDAELAAQKPPAALMRRFGPLDYRQFWTRWTQVEVACKLLDVPVVVWLRRHGLDATPAQIDLCTDVGAGVVVSVGARYGTVWTCDNAALPASEPVRNSV